MTSLLRSAALPGTADTEQRPSSWPGPPASTLNKTVDTKYKEQELAPVSELWKDLSCREGRLLLLLHIETLTLLLYIFKSQEESNHMKRRKLTWYFERC